jgi:exonuclease III
MTSVVTNDVNHLNICSYNIMHGGNNRLNQALRCMRMMNMDLGILTETKLTDGRHTRAAEGFDVVATKAKNKHQGGVAIFYRTDKNDKWVIEGTKCFGPNVIRATLVSGRKRWLIIGAYIPPSETDGSTLNYIQSAAHEANNPIILLGDLNVNLYKMANANERQQETASLIASIGLQGLSQHFKQRNRWGNWTWTQERGGTQLKNICDYILVQEREDFQAFQIKQPRYDSDHRLIKGILRLQSTKDQLQYMRQRSKFPITIQPSEYSSADKIMEKLSKEIEKPEKVKDRQNSWITEGTWQLIDKKADARRKKDADLVQELKKQINKNLKEDRKARTDRVAEQIEKHLMKNQVKEAYETLQGWYKDISGRAPKPTYNDESETRAEYEKLFSKEDPPGTAIPIHIRPRPEIADGPPTEEEVVQALKKMRLRKSPGASGIRVEDLRNWHHEARVKKSQKGIELWEKVLELTQIAFTEGEIPKHFCNGILVLIPKATQGQYRGIALLEIIYKLISAIINRRLTGSIRFHDAVHGFRTGRGTGTAIIEAKLKMQLALRSTKPLYMIFLDLSKAYDTLDRDRTLEILKGYGVGNNVRRIISKVWDGDTMVPKQAGYYGNPFRANRGVRQGDIMSPTIFNIVVDAIIRDWDIRMGTNRGERRETETQFYADDGLISGNDPKEVQRGLDIFIDGFARIGLKMNASKTEAMIIRGAKAFHQLSDNAYNRRMTGQGMTHREYSQQKVQCKNCGTFVKRDYMEKHVKTIKCRNTERTENIVEQGNTAPPENTESESAEYQINMPGKTYIKCPVEGCTFSTEVPGQMRRHFRSRHPNDVIIVEQEGRLPQCTKCGIFQRVVGPEHQRTDDCIKNTATRMRRQDEKTQQEAEKITFTVNEIEIKNVNQFKYLGRILDNKDSDIPAVEKNLQKARQKWARLSRILSKESANPKVMASFYKAIIQSILLYGSESWTIAKNTMQKLNSFHRRCARYITGQHIRQDRDGSWIYPNSKTTLENAGLETIGKYIERRRRTISEYTGGRAIYRRCLKSQPIASNINQLVWWNINYTDA